MQSQYLYPAMKSARRTIPQIDDTHSIDRKGNGLLDRTEIASIDSDRLNNRPKSTFVSRQRHSPPGFNQNLEISGIEETQDFRSPLKLQQHNQDRPEANPKRKLILLQAQNNFESFDRAKPSIKEEEPDQDAEEDSGLPVPFESYENKNKAFGMFNRSPIHAPDGRASKFKEPTWQKQCQRIAMQQ